MSEDYRVNRRSDALVQDIARSTITAYGFENHCPVDILHCLESGWIPTLFGKKQLILNMVSDDRMDDDGETEFKAGAVIVNLKRSVRNLAKYGEGRSRMTCAHELGHGVMHPGAPKSRRTGTMGATALSRVNPEESAEHQAKVFASASLINDKIASKFATAEEISAQFGVSLTAAEIWLERQARKVERELSAKRIEQLIAQAFPDRQRTLSEKIRYADKLCGCCGNPTLIPLGTKYLCQTCDQVSDQFPDGDG
jgi:hypothetical protein